MLAEYTIELAHWQFHVLRLVPYLGVLLLIFLGIKPLTRDRNTEDSAPLTPLTRIGAIGVIVISLVLIVGSILVLGGHGNQQRQEHPLTTYDSVVDPQP